jgi:hypothetical protein
MSNTNINSRPFTFTITKEQRCKLGSQPAFDVWVLRVNGNDRGGDFLSPAAAAAYFKSNF